jgi:hypothetical protein
MFGIGNEEITMGGTGEIPMRIVPHIFEVARPPNWLRVGEVSYGIITTNGDPSLVAPSRSPEQGHKQPENYRGPSKISLAHRVSPAENRDRRLFFYRLYCSPPMARSNASAMRTRLDNLPRSRDFQKI